MNAVLLSKLFGLKRLPLVGDCLVWWRQKVRFFDFFDFTNNFWLRLWFVGVYLVSLVVFLEKVPIILIEG